MNLFLMHWTKLKRRRWRRRRRWKQCSLPSRRMSFTGWPTINHLQTPITLILEQQQTLSPQYTIITHVHPHSYFLTSFSVFIFFLPRSQSTSSFAPLHLTLIKTLGQSLTLHPFHLLKPSHCISVLPLNFPNTSICTLYFSPAFFFICPSIPPGNTKTLLTLHYIPLLQWPVSLP